VSFTPFDAAIATPEGAAVRPVWSALAVAALVAIGAAESLESARQLSLLQGRGRPALAPEGTALTFAGFALSVAVYVALGVALAHSTLAEGAVLRHGALTGLAAGLIGGTIRAVVVSDYLGGVVASFGLPVEFLVGSLAIFVAVSIVASAAGGGVLTWLGFRLGRRPPRLPP
jgi:hypothetical protein